MFVGPFERAVLGNVILGASGVVACKAHLHPLLVSFYRYFLALPLLGVIHGRQWPMPRSRRTSWWMALLALLYLSTDGLWYASADFSNLSTATALQSLAIVGTSISERLRKAKGRESKSKGQQNCMLCGAMLAAIGVCTFVYEHMMLTPASIFLGLGSAAAYALAVTVTAHVCDSFNWNPLDVITIRTALQALYCAALAPAFGMGLQQFVIDVDQLFKMAFVAVLGQVCAARLIFGQLAFLPAGIVAITFAIEPMSVWVGSAIFLGDKFGLNQYVGVLCILLGILFCKVQGFSSFSIPKFRSCMRWFSWRDWGGAKSGLRISTNAYPQSPDAHCCDLMTMVIV